MTKKRTTLQNEWTEQDEKALDAARLKVKESGLEMNNRRIREIAQSVIDLLEQLPLSKVDEVMTRVAEVMEQRHRIAAQNLLYSLFKDDGGPQTAAFKKKYPERAAMLEKHQKGLQEEFGGKS